jgi:hypothetical protein
MNEHQRQTYSALGTWAVATLIVFAILYFGWHVLRFVL